MEARSTSPASEPPATVGRAAGKSLRTCDGVMPTRAPRQISGEAVCGPPSHDSAQDGIQAARTARARTGVVIAARPGATRTIAVGAEPLNAVRDAPRSPR